MKLKLKVLCPQEYEGTRMVAVSCTRCSVGWNGTSCTIETGAEHLDAAITIPTCPIQDRCQHQIQSSTPCVVRSKGLVCESALVASGMPEAEAFDHPLNFNSYMMD